MILRLGGAEHADAGMLDVENAGLGSLAPTRTREMEGPYTTCSNCGDLVAVKISALARNLSFHNWHWHRNEIDLPASNMAADETAHTSAEGAATNTATRTTALADKNNGNRDRGGPNERGGRGKDRGNDKPGWKRKHTGFGSGKYVYLFPRPARSTQYRH